MELRTYGSWNRGMHIAPENAGPLAQRVLDPRNAPSTGKTESLAHATADPTNPATFASVLSPCMPPLPSSIGIWLLQLIRDAA